jgi:hypothetical protein
MPFVFNLMIDAILRAVEVMMTAEIGPHVKPTLNLRGRWPTGGDDPPSFSLTSTSWNSSQRQASK